MTLTIAVTGLGANDNPAPGVPVIRAIREGAGERDLRIVGLTYEALDPGLYMPGIVDSGYLIPFPSQGIDAYHRRIAAIHEKEGIDVFLPTLDSELGLCCELRGEFAALGIRTFLPTSAQLKMRCKARFSALSETHGLSVPKGRTVSSLSELQALESEFPYPIMIKGQFYEAYLARTPFEAEQFFHRIQAKWGLPIIIQEVIDGEEYDVAVVGDGEGGMIGAVPIKKLQITDRGKAWGGVTVTDTDLAAFVKEVIGCLRWNGPCEIEVMRARETGRLYLIEINPRFPAWIYLSAGAGQNLPWAVVELALGEHVGPLPPYRVGTMFLRHSFDQICEMSEYAELTTTGRFLREVQP